MGFRVFRNTLTASLPPSLPGQYLSNDNLVQRQGKSPVFTYSGISFRTGQGFSYNLYSEANAQGTIQYKLDATSDASLGTLNPIPAVACEYAR